ncbi:MAG: pilus (MSHA type) biogenesis protein MshL, partial [Magnetococcales bacterium]|nr:pilus (MSHA type) biogenesis protein MshL [Magnetococcales bacterium]
MIRELLSPRYAPLRRFTAMACALAVLAGCAKQNRVEPSKNHFLRATNPPATSFSRGSTAVGDPDEGKDPNRAAADRAAAEHEVYTISVTDMAVRDLLFALAKDANMNIDVYPGVSGRVTLSAVNQTLPQILDRITKQVNLRYEIDGQTIVVSPDQAYLKIYQVDYVSMTRGSSSSIKVSTQISTGNKDPNNPLDKNVDKNQSDTQVSDVVTNQFWTATTANIQSILGVDESAIAFTKENLAGLDGTPSGTGPLGAGETLLGEAPSVNGGGPGAMGKKGGIPTHMVTINAEAGLISVFGTARQHERVQKFLDKAMENVQRQVLIESTVVEVELSDRHQEGVNWHNIMDRDLRMGRFETNLNGSVVNGTTMSGLRGMGNFVDSAVNATTKATFFTLPFSTGNPLGPSSLEATLYALQQYGNTKVLSSPKIMSLNNQTAVLKVVENTVFFTMDAKATSVTSNNTTQSVPLFTTNVHTVPVGLVMTVTPQISDEDVVTLNVHPTISSISGWQNDPNPMLKKDNTITKVTSDVESRIPIIQIKEMSSVLRIQSGQVAVMGGLMQDKIQKDQSGLPVLGDLPVIGTLFRYRDDQVKKSELVIFMRPVVMTHGRAKTGNGGVVNAMSAPQQPLGGGGGPGPAPSWAPSPQGGSNSYLDFTRPPGGGSGFAPSAIPALPPEPQAGGGRQSVPPAGTAPIPPPGAAGFMPGGGYG